MRMSHGQRARRYLQASVSSGFPHMKPEHVNAYRQQMREHERAYARVREHALAGADQDFDKPLTKGEREHQTHLREKEGLEHKQVLGIRSELRARKSTLASRAAEGARPGARAARTAAAAGGGAIGAGISGTGSLPMQIIGLALLLSLVYLLVAGKGSAVVAGISRTVVGGVNAFVQPVDPIAKLESALGATPIAGASASASPPGVSSPSPSTLTPTHTAPGGRTASPPAQAGALTWPSLRRQIEAHKLTPAQVQHDLNILTGKAGA